MTTNRFPLLAFFVSLCCASPGAPAEGADFTGAWATDAAVCTKLFVKSGNRVSFTKDASFVGGRGFIIERGELRAQTAVCRIKTTKEGGAVTHMIVACATDILLSDLQFSVRVIDDNTIVRMFPGISEIEIKYHRCFMS